jgi:predicted small secreted protein
MKMRKIAVLLPAIVLVAGLLAACGGGSQTGSDESADATGDAAAGVIKVGYVNPSTGPLAGNG